MTLLFEINNVNGGFKFADAGVIGVVQKNKSGCAILD